MDWKNRIRKEKIMKIILDNPEQTDVKELRELWSEVFHDEDWYLDLFFKNIFDRKNTLVGKTEGKIVAMLYMVPYKLKYENSVYDIMYLYALATNKDFRKKGIMKRLIKKSEEIVESLGYIGSFLVPAEESLVSYYENMGFDKVIGSNIYDCDSEVRVAEIPDIQNNMDLELNNRKNHIILSEKQEFVNNQVFLHEQFIKKNEKIKSDYCYIVNDDGIRGLFRMNKHFINYVDIISIVNEKYIDICIDGVLL